MPKHYPKYSMPASPNGTFKAQYLVYVLDEAGTYIPANPDNPFTDLAQADGFCDHAPRHLKPKICLYAFLEPTNAGIKS